MTKALLVDTNFSSVPIYRALLETNDEVHVVGGNPSDCLAKQASHYWNLDYSDIELLSDLIDKQGFDYIVPGCTDRSYESCVIAGRGRFTGIDSPSATTAISNKAAFRRVAASIGLPIPAIFHNPMDAIGHKAIVKPVDAFSGKGITVLPNASSATIHEAITLAHASSPSRQALVEEFVEGQLYSHSAFLVDRKVLCDFLVQEDGTANRFVVDTSRVLAPSVLPLLLVKIRKSVETLAEHLGLNDGLLHTQFIANEAEIWLIESTRRCPGDLYSQLIEFSTGYPYAHSYAMAFTGGVPTPRYNDSLRPVMRHTISVPAEQTFDHVRFLRRMNIISYVPLSLAGDILLPSPRSRVAIMFCQERSQGELDKLYTATLRRELYEVSNGMRSIDGNGHAFRSRGIACSTP